LACIVIASRHGRLLVRPMPPPPLLTAT
jgi:hypothetical protein